jgi:hypothetical protein
MNRDFESIYYYLSNIRIIALRVNCDTFKFCTISEIHGGLRNIDSNGE